MARSSVLERCRGRWGSPVVLGLRFFPRYYFLLLPPLMIAGARGWSIAGPRWVLAGLLLIPAARFGPSYLRVHSSRDLSMDRDSKQAADILRARSHPGETL